MGDELEEDQEPLQINLEDPRGSMKEYLQIREAREEVKRRFREFLTTFLENGRVYYVEKMREMAAQNRESLEVAFFHLCERHQLLARWVADEPGPLLEVLDEAATELTLRYFPEYRRICPSVHVRISNLPACDTLREIRQAHLNKLIKVRGVVTRRSSVIPQLREVKMDCQKCGHTMGPILQGEDSEIRVKECPSCKSKGPFSLNSESTIYRNYQSLTLQESPGQVPAGRLPRTKQVIITADLIDSARPGDEVEVTFLPKSLNV